MIRCELCHRTVEEAFELPYGIICRDCLAELFANEKTTMDELAALITAGVVDR